MRNWIMIFVILVIGYVLGRKVPQLGMGIV